MTSESVIAAVDVSAANARCWACNDSRSLSRSASSLSMLMTSDTFVACWYSTRKRVIAPRALATRDVTSATREVTSRVESWRDFSTPRADSSCSTVLRFSGGTRSKSVADGYLPVVRSSVSTSPPTPVAIVSA